MMDYKDTLNLPRTKFSMKANLAQMEPSTLENWESMDIYGLIQKARKDNEKYILHDGPPYANGDIHIGHALNKILKDIIVKYKTMQRFNSAYVPGWDCHGLPVEHQLFKELGISKHQMPKIDFRKKAHDYAKKFVDIQKEQFERLGVFGDWEKPYITMSRDYEAAIVRSFGHLVKEGYIYKGLKPVNWCYQCETALAEAEVEYEDHASPSIYVKFKLLQGRTEQDAHILIWTTTPWTLIANVAVAVHPDFEYAFVSAKEQTLIIAKQLVDSVMEKCGITEFKILKTAKGTNLEGWTYKHPFDLREGKVVLADYVSLEEGTGCVHTAPGHGLEDYTTGMQYDLPVVMPVDEKGLFTDEAGEFKGQHVHKANAGIIEKLKKLELLLAEEEIAHSYPHCWRCKNPIIFRATEQWFMSIDKNSLRSRLKDAIEKDVEWIPQQGKERISTMVNGRPDWCLSRQRYWGVPIPIFLCKSCSEWICEYELVERFATIVSEEGTDAWFEKDVKQLLPAGYKCPNCRGQEFEKGEDILDVWFDSGVSHQAVLKTREELAYPCSLYLEGSDQHRGWFQSALITAIAIDKISPYKTVLTHGFVVDGLGRKMSKSVGNVVSPQRVIKDCGADILRLWVSSCDYTEDVRISEQILSRLTESYRKIRNTARYILGNLYDFNPKEHTVSYDKLLQIDKWALLKTYKLLKAVTSFYERFAFHKVYKELYNFCIVYMSNFYLDILKDRLYTFGKNSVERRSGQTALYEIINILSAVIAPILSFTAEELWSYIPKAEKAKKSVHLLDWPEFDETKIDSKLDEQWQKLIDIRETVLKQLEEMRSKDVIGSSLEAEVNLYVTKEESFNFLKAHEGRLCSIFIVSAVNLHKQNPPEDAVCCEGFPDIYVKIKKAKGEKCPRCWNYSVTVGEDEEHPQLCNRCVNIVKSISH